MYLPCNFDRRDYTNTKAFLTGDILPDPELEEFNYDAAGLAVELAYTRFLLFQTEQLLGSCLFIVPDGEGDYKLERRSL